MVAHSVCHELDEEGFPLLHDVLSGLAGGLQTSQSVVAVHSGRRDIVGDRTGNHSVRNVLVGRGSRNRVLVVATQEQSLAAQGSCEVKSH